VLAGWSGSALTFLGSPLNRLSFLRTDHPFLSAAVKHPSTRFVLLKDLAPLTKTPSELYYAHYDEVKKLVPETIYDKTEEETIKQYDSRKTVAQLIFLGLDESRKQDGLAWKIYTGAPCFALDVTPKGTEEQQANAKGVISAMEAKGLSFFQSRVVMTFSADDGKLHALYIPH
jgi:NAD+ diphosphatase